MGGADLDVVTGAFGFTGKHIAGRLLALDRRVRTLTAHPNRPDPFGGRVEVAPLAFHDPAGLARALEGATTLFNTYWIRFPYAGLGYETAVERTERLLRAAREAGVRRVVHISITNAAPTSPFPYFRGKGAVEQSIRDSGLSHAILRPALIFGPGDILVNNIAWCLRRFPIFAVPGRGDYRVQPIYVEDLAELAVAAGARHGDERFDAGGPESFSFDELVRLIAAAVGRPARIIHLPAAGAYALARLIGFLVGDVVLTRDEVGGLMANLLVSAEPPRGGTRIGDWLAVHARQVGAAYASELARHFR